MGRVRNLALVASLAAALLPLAAPGATAAPSGLTLPFSGFSDMVVDGADQRLFISGGASSQSIAVFDLSGTFETMLEEQFGASDMILDGGLLYVALSGDDAIRVIDPATLDTVNTFPTDPVQIPNRLAMAGGRLWFSYGQCGGPDAGVASMDPLDGSVQTYPDSGFPSGCPALASPPSQPDTLMAWDTGLSPPTIQVFDVSGDPTETMSRVMVGLGDIDDVTFTPDGTKVLVVAAEPYAVKSFGLSDLEPAGSDYDTSPSPTSVAMTPARGGRVAAGLSGPDDTDLQLFDEGSSTSEFSTTLGGDVVGGGLAFSPDGSKLYAIARDWPWTEDGTFVFHVVNLPDPAPSSLSLALSRTRVAYDHAVTVTAHLQTGDGATNRSVSIYRTPYGGSKTLVKAAQVDGSGNLSVSVKPATRTTFVAEYAGDAADSPATSGQKTVNVSALAGAKMIGGYDTYGRWRLYHFTTKCKATNLSACPRVLGTVMPDHTGSVLEFIVQGQVGEGWQTGLDTSHTLGPGSGIVLALVGAPRGHAYRARTIFAGDAANTGDASPWVYFEVI